MINCFFVFLFIFWLFAINKTIDMFLQKYPRTLAISSAISILMGAFCIVIFVANVLPISEDIDDFYIPAIIVYVVSILFSLVFVSIADIYTRLIAQQTKK